MATFMRRICRTVCVNSTNICVQNSEKGIQKRASLRTHRLHFRLCSAMNILHIGTDESYDIEIREDELPKITNAQLKRLRITRAELRRCFAEGMRLMRDQGPGARVRPVAMGTLDGEWEVHIVRYSPLNDPPMLKRAKGKA